MRVLFIHPAYPSQFTAIAHAMAGVTGVETAFLTDAAFGDQIRSDNVPIPYYGYTKDSSPGESVWYMTSYDEGIRHGKGVCDVMPDIMTSFPPDVVVGHASFGSTFFLKNMFRIPVISYVELPGYHMAWCRSEYPPLAEHLFLNSAFQSLVYASAVNSDRVIVPSRHAATLFPAELQPKIRVQMEGFKLPEICPDKQFIRMKYGLPANGPIIGFASRTLEAMRGFDIFLNVVKRLKAIRLDLHVLVVGSEQTVYGNELSYLGGKSFKQQTMDDLEIGEDFFISRDYLANDAFHEHLQAMDLILFPLFEGAANWGLFEAMASGVPVIASNRCFIPEVISHGEDGFMFDPYAIDDMVNQSLAILENPEGYSAVGTNARNKIRDYYSVENSVKGYLDVIAEVIGLDI
jgi:glycosyltransferase involved in cell wall biosynthesis